MAGINKNIEFVDQQTEQKENRKGSLKDIFNGRVLAREKVVKQLPFVLFLTFLIILYIGNRYQTEKVVRQTIRLQNELKELRAEAISTASELEYLSRQSQVTRLLEEKEMDLEESVVPPKKIVVKNKKRR